MKKDRQIDREKERKREGATPPAKKQSTTNNPPAAFSYNEQQKKTKLKDKLVHKTHIPFPGVNLLYSALTINL